MASFIFRTTVKSFQYFFILHGYRLFKEEICNEYAAQAMFFQRQTFPTEKSQKKLDFFLAFFDFRKKPKVFKKSQNFNIWLPKSQIGNPDTMHKKDYYKKNRSVAIKHTSKVLNRRGSSIQNRRKAK